MNFYHPLQLVSVVLLSLVMGVLIRGMFPSEPTGASAMQYILLGGCIISLGFAISSFFKREKT